MFCKWIFNLQNTWFGVPWCYIIIYSARFNTKDVQKRVSQLCRNIVKILWWIRAKIVTIGSKICFPHSIPLGFWNAGAWCKGIGLGIGILGIRLHVPHVPPSSNNQKQFLPCTTSHIHYSRDMKTEHTLLVIKAQKTYLDNLWNWVDLIDGRN